MKVVEALRAVRQLAAMQALEPFGFSVLPVNERKANGPHVLRCEGKEGEHFEFALDSLEGMDASRVIVGARLAAFSSRSIVEAAPCNE